MINSAVCDCDGRPLSVGDLIMIVGVPGSQPTPRQEKVIGKSASVVGFEFKDDGSAWVLTSAPSDVAGMRWSIFHKACRRIDDAPPDWNEIATRGDQLSETESSDKAELTEA